MLREFLLANRAAILVRTRSKVDARRGPFATDEGREAWVATFLDQLAAALGSPAGSFHDAIREGATRHGGDFLKKGFTVAELVHSYGGVCQALTELAAEVNAAITAAEFHTFNGCLDAAIAGAATEHARGREQTLAEAERERSGELAHELRNALCSASVAFEALRAGNIGFGGSTAAVLGRSLQNMATLISSSMALVRLGSGIQMPERVSMREFVEEVEVGAVMDASARNLTLAVSTVEPGIDVKVDRQLLAGAVANLLQNAFKFSRPNGRVSLKASATEERVLIEVEDECGGLPPNASEVLFRPFVQAGADRTGLGLGLSVARKSVTANSGELRVQDLPGSGCIFTIDLPRLSALG